MENLTKHQIILLTLLVSFVTSIATGIVTVALMNQAPLGVTQTINRVVERTIEKVVTPATPTSAPTTVVKETIVVNEGDQIVSAIEKNSNSLVRIYKTDIDTMGSQSIIIVGIGAVITDDGVIATDNNIISDSGKYFITTDDSKLHDLIVLRSTGGEQIALLKIKQDDKNPVTFKKVNISNQELKLGQSVVYIGGDTKNIVATGIISSINTKDIKTDTASSSATTSTKVVSIETTVPTKNFISGGLLLNLSGELVGIKAIYLDSEKTYLFAPSYFIKTTLSNFTDSQKKP